MDFGLKGKTAVVCGASAGLGLAAAEALAAEGAHCVLVARREDRLADICTGLKGRFGVEATYCATDLASPEGVARAVEFVEAESGRADILVTNAGGPPAGGFEESVSEEKLRLGWELTFMSAVRMIRGLLPGMRRRKWGRIVAITSLSVHEPVAGLALSNAYRPGLTGLLKTLSTEVAAEGITVNSVCPGYTRTDRLEELARAASGREGKPWESYMEAWARATPAGRVGDPSELAAAVAFLCSQQAAYITGVALPVDGGRVHHLLA